MDLQQKLLYLLVDLILPLLAGHALARWTRVRREGVDRMMVVAILVFSPVLTGFSVWKANLEVTVLLLPLLGSLMQILPGVAGFFLGRMRYADPLDRGSYILTSMFSNRSTIGILSAYILFGQEGFAYTRITLLLGAPTFYLVGFTLARYYYEKSRADTTGRPSLRQLLFNRNQLPLVGILIGLLLNLGGVERPARMIDPVFDGLVHVMAWLFMVPIGFSFNYQRLRPYLGAGLEISLVRFLVTPLLVVPLAWWAGLTGVLFWTILVLSLTPSSVGAVVAAKLHGLNEHLPLAAYLVSSLLYLLLVFPLLILLLGH